MRKDQTFILSKDDWSLHRKGYEDQARHQEKVKEAIKKNLPDLVTEESVILSNGREVIKIPIRSLDEYKFRYNYNKQQHAGQGDGDSQVGDVVARDGKPQGPGKGQGAGDQAGEDYYEAEVDVEQLQEMLFSELALPNLKQKEKDQIKVKDIRFNDIRKKGLMGNIDKKRTLLEAIRRNALEGKRDKDLLKMSIDDLRFKTWEEVVQPHSNAVIIAMMDTSGSMGVFEKYVARSFFFWMTRFLRTKYEHVDIVFVAHHTEAKEVSEEAFFTKGESGGTICSSAYRKALEIIEERYSPERYNIYPFHFSDGDNLTSDNERCLKLVKKLMDISNMFGYGEVNQYNRSSTLMSAYRKIDDPRFRYAIIREKHEVYQALKTFFSENKEAVGS
ncbi:sporulation protein YhbH [Caldalkalibacillus salinus]|uniref:sporulation protein YhbH n=1 Tax=Caldalkalibacillus salinus TaxID=2803787 RepID=UPI0019228F43